MTDSEILTAFFVSLRRDEFSLRQLLALSAPFGITETNLRSMLSRMNVRNTIEIRKEGKTAFYRLSLRGKRIGSNISLHFRGLDWSSWAGSFWGAAFSISKPQERYRIQKKLLAYRFRPLYPGYWIRPFHADEQIHEVFKESDNIELFTCVFNKSLSPDRISKLYGLAEISGNLEKAISTASASIRLVHSLQSDEVFLEYIRTGDLIVKALAGDPLLPPSLLPDKWPGNGLRDVFKTWNLVYGEQYKAFVRSALED